VNSISTGWRDKAGLLARRRRRLLAEGTDTAPIRFTVAPGSGVSWVASPSMVSTGSPETRIRLCSPRRQRHDLHRTGRRHAVSRHTTFGTTTYQYLSLDSGSFLISHLRFPSSTAPFEPGAWHRAASRPADAALCAIAISARPPALQRHHDFNRRQPQIWASRLSSITTMFLRARATTSSTWTAPTPGSRETFSCTLTETARRTAPARSAAATTAATLRKSRSSAICSLTATRRPPPSRETFSPH